MHGASRGTCHANSQALSWQKQWKKEKRAEDPQLLIFSSRQFASYLFSLRRKLARYPLHSQHGATSSGAGCCEHFASSSRWPWPSAPPA